MRKIYINDHSPNYFSQWYVLVRKISLPHRVEIDSYVILSFLCLLSSLGYPRRDTPWGNLFGRSPKKLRHSTRRTKWRGVVLLCGEVLGPDYFEKQRDLIRKEMVALVENPNKNTNSQKKIQIHLRPKGKKKRRKERMQTEQNPHQILLNLWLSIKPTFKIPAGRKIESWHCEIDSYVGCWLAWRTWKSEEIKKSDSHGTADPGLLQ